MRVGAYEVQGELGRGGMGVVLRARSPDGKPVAIKVLLKPDARKSLDRFERERRLLASLGDSAGFVPLVDAGDSEKGPYFVMPLVEGGTLRDRLRNGALGIEEAARLGAKLARTLGLAHAKGIVHRDLKPENVLFDAKGRPLIADLGLAKHFRHDAPGASRSVSLSADGELRGTAGYMAPEQLQDAKSAGPQADVFALGAILYECLTGRSAFEGDSMPEVLMKIAQGKKEPVEQLRPEVPAWLAGVVEEALATDPAERFPDGEALARALEAGAGRKRRARSRRPLVLAALLAFAAAGAILVAAHFLQGGARPSPSELKVAIDDASFEGEGTLRVRGRVSGEATALKVNGVVFPLEDGKFDGKLSVKGDEAALTATAEDRQGNQAIARRVVARPKLPGERSAPAWFAKLPETERPPLPLPKEIEFGKEPGEYVNRKDGSVLVFVPAGVFRMGHDDLSDAERPVHDVDLSAYFIGKYELTHEKFEAFVRATGYTTEPEKDKLEANWRTPLGDGKKPPADFPVVCVTWLDAREYCRWAGLRLPTEAEWEKAAAWDPREKRARAFPWGDRAPGAGTPLYANLPDESLRRLEPLRKIFEGYDDGSPGLSPVGKFPSGASFYGAHDMMGNAAEWCQDQFFPDFYANSPRKDPIATPVDKRNRVFRGGGFLEFEPNAQSREYPYAQTAHEWLGFRVAR